MNTVGTAVNPLRVAIIGSGPAGFYTLAALQKAPGLSAKVDLYDRLPTPFGLVRSGVAPDHQRIKTVTAFYDRIFRSGDNAFFGNLSFGDGLSLADLQHHYHQVVFATGAANERPLGVPGEDLPGSHAATDFVGWYNGHPEFCHLNFDLRGDHAIIVGVGNVALDVARMLCRSPEELEQTDAPGYTIDALRHHGIRRVTLLGRRGPAQAAFSFTELAELAELPNVGFDIAPRDAVPDLLDGPAENLERGAFKNVQLLQALSRRPPGQQAGSRKVTICFRFLVSPLELIPGPDGHLQAIRLVHNELQRSDGGRLRAVATERTEIMEAGLLFRSIGYRGTPLPELPFDERGGIIPNNSGRILSNETKAPLPGLYTTGWIRRGPTGLIGTNKVDAQEVVEAMLADLGQGQINQPSAPSREALRAVFAERDVAPFSYDDWLDLDREEIARGKALGRPRLKFTSVDEMIAFRESARGRDASDDRQHRAGQLSRYIRSLSAGS